jgi:hypothetical protein
MNQWVEGTLFDNVDKFATALGYDNAGVVLPLAMIPWQSVQDRNNFIQMLTDKSEIQGIQTNHLSEANQKAKVK